jgi:3-phosphoshikimate 1-carboxyvinyltransferase
MVAKNTLISFRQSHLRGTLLSHTHIPGDKSISHRALFLSALATGSTTINGINSGEDVEHTQLALESLGVSIENISPVKKSWFTALQEPLCHNQQTHCI